MPCWTWVLGGGLLSSPPRYTSDYTDQTNEGADFVFPMNTIEGWRIRSEPDFVRATLGVLVVCLALTSPAATQVAVAGEGRYRLRTTIGAIEKDFERNAVAADKKYGPDFEGRKILFSAVVDRVRQSDIYYFLEFKDQPIFGADCVWEVGLEPDEAATLSAGDRIQVVADYASASTGGGALIENCKIISRATSAK